MADPLTPDQVPAVIARLARLARIKHRRADLRGADLRRADLMD